MYLPVSGFWTHVFVAGVGILIKRDEKAKFENWNRNVKRINLAALSLRLVLYVHSMAGIPDLITLALADDVQVKIPVAFAKKLRTIYEQIEDIGADQPSPVPLITERIFKLIQEYSDVEDAVPPSFFLDPSQQRPVEIAAFFERIQSQYVPPIDEKTKKPVPRNTIVFELIVAANYLNYNLPKLESGKFQRCALLQEASREIALQIAGKTPDELRANFLIGGEDK